MVVTENKILTWLEEVKDPEIPALSLIDLGIIRDVDISDKEIKITMTPTFSGCPAIEVMKDDIINTLLEKGVNKVSVEVTFKNHWTTDMITDKGRSAIKAHGIAPPQSGVLVTDLHVLEQVKCPHCDSDQTELKTPFGPTLCRSIHYCNGCKQAFEQFKPLQ